MASRLSWSSSVPLRAGACADNGVLSQHIRTVRARRRFVRVKSWFFFAVGVSFVEVKPQLACHLVNNLLAALAGVWVFWEFWVFWGFWEF